MITMEHAAAGERAVARRLIRAIFKRNYTISVFDGEEWTVKSSSSEKTILAALATTDCDILRVRTAAPERTSIGAFTLIWGNADDGSELIADHTDNSACDEIYDSLNIA